MPGFGRAYDCKLALCSPFVHPSKLIAPWSIKKFDPPLTTMRLDWLSLKMQSNLGHVLHLSSDAKEDL
jgi:hypothetical protein